MCPAHPTAHLGGESFLHFDMFNGNIVR